MRVCVGGDTTGVILFLGFGGKVGRGGAGKGGGGGGRSTEALYMPVLLKRVDIFLF